MKCSSSTDRAMFASSGERIPPYEQRRVMRSVDLSGLVRAVVGGRALRITPGGDFRAWRAS